MLASYSNVRLLGYVHTTYATRNISLVRRDIETYAAWPNASSNPDLTVRGIFFDETPQEYSDQSHAYLQNLTDLVKDLDGFGPEPFVSCNFPWQSLSVLFLFLSFMFPIFQAMRVRPRVASTDIHALGLQLLFPSCRTAPSITTPLTPSGPPKRRSKYTH